MLTKLFIVILISARLKAESSENEGSSSPFDIEENKARAAELQTLAKEIELIIKEINTDYEKWQLNKEPYLADFLRTALLDIYPTLCLPVDKVNGEHYIQIDDENVEVECNGEIDGPGWLLIQKHIKDNFNIKLDWSDYRYGFGNTNGSYFIGLQKLHQLTSFMQHELYIQLTDLNGKIRYAKYDNFKIKRRTYKLESLGEYTGTAGDALRSAEGKYFRVFDSEDSVNGGWWISEDIDGIESNLWQTWPTDFNSVQMFIRPILKFNRQKCETRNRGLRNFICQTINC